tara:strand:+ start:4117 stop:7698 length:3582 start_codon:yes stop_codon:yes gene_type:complete
MLNEDLNNQTDNMLSQDSEKDRITQALLKEREGFKLRPTEEIIDKAKATGTGLLTGTLAIPSDLVTLSSAVASGVAKYSDSPTAMMLKDVLQKAEKEVGREAFDKWFTKTTGIESTPDNVDQLIGEILSPTGAFLAPVKTLKKVFAPLKKGVTDFFDKMPPPDGGLALETAGATKPVGQLDQTEKLLDQEKAVTTNIPSSIPADEIINAPKINPTMAGMNTATGKLQARRFMDLEAKGNITPEKLFEETGVYRGQDGKLRYEIDDRNAEFVKGFKPKSGEDYALYKVLKFDDLYKEYGKDLTVGGRRYGSLRNIRVNFIRDTDTSYLGKYEPDVDAITINLSKESNKDPEKMISTLLHEVQHAVQRREGFITGTSPERQLIESPNYDDYLKAKSYVENRTIRDKKTGAYITPSEAAKKQITEDELIDDIPPNTFISNDRRNTHVNQLNNDIRVYNAFLKTKDLKTRSNLQEVIAKQMLSKKISVKEAAQLDPAILAKETYDFLITDIRNITGKSFDEAEKYISRYRDVVEKERKATELMQSEEAIAREKYYTKYGEREAKLVQQRYERRLALKEAGLDDDVIKKDMRLATEFLKGEDTTLGQMGGFGSREKKRLDKLKRTDPVTGKVKPKIAIDIPVAREKNMAKGGDMKKQMDLFQEGGLKDEGGTVDPVSGNDVPPGSTQEEVRDDIPAQLSEGEFVFPADVVRYIGLEKLMMLRQEAKAGLKRMEEMGQMGNSDEATLPDDIPFTIDDLDMEDELEYNEGGVVQAQTGTFVAPGSGVTTMPSQFAGQQLPSAGATPSYTVPTIPPPVPAPVGGFRPLTTSAQTGQQATGTTPSFQTLIGTKPGQYDEFREYVNESGMKLQIPFKDGQPIYPIPEGYTFVDPEEVKTEEVTTKEVTPQTTRVVEQDGGDDPDPKSTSAVDLVGDPLSYKSMFNMDKLDTALKDIAFGQLNLFDPKAAITRGFTGNINLNSITLDIQRQNLENFKNQSNIIKKYGTNFNLVNMDLSDRDALANKFERTGDIIENVLTDSNNNPLDIDGMVSKANKTYGIDIKKEDLFSKGTNVLSQSEISKLAKDMADAEAKRIADAQKAREAFEKESDTTSDAQAGAALDAISQQAAQSAQGKAEQAFQDTSAFGDSSSDDSPSDTGTTNDSMDAAAAGGGDSFGLFKQGGLASKRKPKVKKMKRGGLASR